MGDIVEFISASWVEWIFAIVTAVLAYLYRGISARLAQEQAKNQAIANGVQSLLRESIVHNYNKYSERGYAPIWAKESLKMCYSAYHDLGGNDVATQLYHKMLAMPEQEEKHDN